jgi:hypothetical protein
MRDERLNFFQKNTVSKSLSNNVVKVIKGGYCNYLFYILAKSILTTNQDVENGKSETNPNMVD